MKNFLYLTAIIMLAGLTGCVNDDSDMSDVISGGGTQPAVTPIDINLDYTALDEAPDIPPTDATDPDFNDYEENTDWTYTIRIAYDGENATLSGNTNRVRYNVNGAHVTINTTSTRINYILSGNSNNGSLKIYSESKFKLTLEGVNLTNPTGAPINNQCGKSLYLVLADGTDNSLTDAENYTDVTGEDLKAALFSEGQILVSGTGMLNINATGRNGIASDDYLRFRPGCKINITSTAGHGIKANDGIYIDGGVFNVTVAANGAKGINSDNFVRVAGGRTTIITTGGSAITAATNIAPADTSSCAGIKSDSTLTVVGGILRLKSTGEGGKGLNAGKSIDITGGNIAVVTTGVKGDASPKGIKADLDISISGGSVYSYSAFAAPVDAAGALNIAPGWATYESIPRRFTIAY